MKKIQKKNIKNERKEEKKRITIKEPMGQTERKYIENTKTSAAIVARGRR
jgi:hypothetical protein